MDIPKLRWTKLQTGLFSLLCLKSGEKLSQREIAKILEVSPTAVSKSLKQLEKDHLITLEKIKTINFISFNRDNEQAVKLKRVENLRTLYLSGLSAFLEKELAGGTIFLFGSYSRGEDTSSSDIDIAVIGRKEKKIALEKFEEILGRKISLHFYDFWKNIQVNLKNNILNGIILEGSVEI